MFFGWSDLCCAKELSVAFVSTFQCHLSQHFNQAILININTVAIISNIINLAILITAQMQTAMCAKQVSLCVASTSSHFNPSSLSLAYSPSLPSTIKIKINVQEQARDAIIWEVIALVE